MKTEWHRYNLKRRVAQLPPIPADQFAEKLQLSEQTQSLIDEFGFPVLKPVSQHNRHAIDKRKPHRKHSREVKPNEKEVVEEDVQIGHSLAKVVSAAESIESHFSKLSVNTENTNTTDFGEDTVSEYGFTSDSNYDYNSSEHEDDLHSDQLSVHDKYHVTDCIYCGVKNKEIERNVKHMFHKHGLYIPERSYLVDLKGLLNFLIEIIIIEKTCLCCNFQGSTLESIRDHMRSKRHCRMPYETKEERQLFAPFYDFSSLEEEEKEETGKTSAKPNSKQIHFNEAEKEIPEEDINSNYTTVSVDETGLEMILPTGARLGHRAGQRYYRQNIPVSSQGSESRNTVTAADRRMISGVTEKQYKKGLKKMQQLEKRAIDEQFRRDVKRLNFQTYYRDELLQ